MKTVCTRFKLSEKQYIVSKQKKKRKKPDFCRKISIKCPSNSVNTRLGGFIVLSDFHGVSSLKLGF